VIEDLLKRTTNNKTTSPHPRSRSDLNGPLHIRLDDLSRVYNELVAKYARLEREKAEMQLNLEEMARANKMLEGEFDGYFKTLTQHLNDKDKT